VSESERVRVRVDEWSERSERRMRRDGNLASRPRSHTEVFLT
jgi:hypothetical protein